MSTTTGIEWTDSTWNPVTGCTEVSPGCDHCYAKTFAERWRGTPGHHFENGFDVQLRPDKLDLPLRWRKPRKVFVNSMSDLFHDHVPDIYIAGVFAVMARAPQHTFQLLTKRHGRMRSLLNEHDFPARVIGSDEIPWPLPNVWLGVSAENQQWADIRIPALLDTPAAVRFVSAEPLLGPLDLTEWIGCPHDSLSGVDVTALDNPKKRWRCDQCCASVIDGTVENVGLHWIIVGGESGRNDRPMQAQWVRSIRDQCQASGVAFFFKQWGETVPLSQMTEAAAQRWFDYHGGEVWPEESLWRVGKKAAGRELDGRTWDEYPAAVKV